MRQIAIALLLVLAGCSAATSRGSRYRLEEPRPWGNTSVQWLTACSPNPDVGSVRCNVVLTGNPTDEEAWMFEARIKVYWSGIPVGREPQDYLVAGTREHCEAIRTSTFASTLWSTQREVPPTDQCKGPFYYRKESGKS